jgi:NTE family protein
MEAGLATLDSMTTSPRTALVLSGGGLVGGAWMIGALNAIATETGWDPGSADYVFGTSAGSMIGAMLASAVPPWLLQAYALDESLRGLPGLAEPGGKRFGTTYRLHWSFPRPVLASPGLALRSLREPWKYGPAGIVAWLPQGVISTEPLRAVISRLVPAGWIPSPLLWVVAIDYQTGERVVFGRPGSPSANLADAVAASCAIPGFYHPVVIHDRRYIDGGMYSPSNLDLLSDTDAELIVCLNPMSSRYRGGLFEPTGPIASFVRGDNRHLMDREVLALERKGKDVLLIEPKKEDLQVMGLNSMSRRRLDEVVNCALQSTTRELRDTQLGDQLAILPAGPDNRLRRPTTKPSSWPAKLFPPARRSA